MNDYAQREALSPPAARVCLRELSSLSCRSIFAFSLQRRVLPLSLSSPRQSATFWMILMRLLYGYFMSVSWWLLVERLSRCPICSKYCTIRCIIRGGGGFTCSLFTFSIACVGFACTTIGPAVAGLEISTLIGLCWFPRVLNWLCLP